MKFKEIIEQGMTQVGGPESTVGQNPSTPNQAIAQPGAAASMMQGGKPITPVDVQKQRQRDQLQKQIDGLQAQIQRLQGQLANIK